MKERLHCRLRFLVVTLITGILLSACQPTAEDRIARASEAMAAGDYRSAVLEARSALQDSPANIQARLIFAESSKRVGDYRTAAAEYSRAAELGADLSQFAFEYAESLLVVGGAREVIEQLQEALEAEPVSAQRITLLGHAFAAVNEREQAVERYTQALELDDRMADAYVGLASLAERASDAEAVDRWLGRARMAVPESPELLLFLAQREQAVDARTPLVERAYQSLDRSSSDVTRAQVLLVRVENFLQRKDLESAEASLAEYGASFPGAPQSLFLQSLIALERGNIDRARAGLLRISEGVAEGSPADLFLGSINLQQSNLRQAEAYLSKALRFDSTSVAARKLLAETLLQLGRPQEALEVLSDFAPQQTQDPQVLALLGRAAVASGNPSDGVEFFQRSSEQLPDDPGLRLATAYSYLASGRAAEALKILESVEDDATGAYRGSLLRMLAHLASDDRASAVGEAERLVASNPDDASAWSLAGQLMGNLKEFAIARRYYKDALSIDADHIPSRYGLARVDLADGKINEAEQLLAALLDDHPDYMPGLATFAQLAMRSRRSDLAIERVQAAVDAAPEAVEPRFLLAQHLLFTGDLEQALFHAEQGLEIAPDNARLLQMRGKARGRLGSEQAARNDLIRAAELAPTDRLMQMDKARVQINMQDLVGARRTIADYLELRPDDNIAKLFAADLDLSEGSLDKAALAVTEVLKAEPDNVSALVLQGDILNQRGDLEGALELFERAGRVQMDRRVLLRQFSIRRKLDVDEAQSLLEEWLRENPNDVQVQSVLAQALDTKGDRRAAIALYEQLAGDDRASDQSRAVVLNNLAWLYSASGDDRARATAEQARELLPNSAAVNDTLGWIAFNEGDTESALESLRRANELDGRDPEIAWHFAAALARNGEREQALRLLGRALETDQPFADRALAKTLFDQLSGG
ncbi:MAG: XrtA/PEP-CTERM system TPR-repeat protein PrsT [Pseudomonadota bacterium]